LDRFVELGGNCIDTANFFPWFGPTSGESERIIGNWLSKRNDRESLVIITKIRLPTDSNNVNAVGLGRNHVIQSVESCLRRLQTNYIDLLQIEGWDYSVDVKEIVRICDELLMSGKIRNMGLCDFKGWQLQRMIDTSTLLNKHKFACFQGEYNLLSRGCEMEVVDVCLNHNLGFIAYSPFKYGFLTGQTCDLTNPEEGSRLEAAVSGEIPNLSGMAEPFDIMKMNPCFNQLHQTIQQIASSRNFSISDIALRWVLQQEFVSTVVIGVNNIQELEDNMRALTEFELTEDEMIQLDRASSSYLPYPYLSIPTDICRKLFMHTPGPVLYSQLAYLTQAITLNDRMFDFGFDQKHFDQSHIQYGMKHEKQQKHHKTKHSKQRKEDQTKQQDRPELQEQEEQQVRPESPTRTQQQG